MNELYNTPEVFLCPDFGEFDLVGDTLDGTHLSF